MSRGATLQWLRTSLLRMSLGLVAGPVSGMAFIFLSSPLNAIQPAWAGEALTGFAAAAIWMTAGLLIARRLPVVGPLLFLPGAALAWLLCRAIVHSVSPYYGLFPFAMSCLGGMAAWVTIALRARQRYAGIAAVILPLLVVTAGFIRALNEPSSLGVVRRMVVNGRPATAHMAWSDSGRTAFLWEAVPPEQNAEDARDVLVEEDPGSGTRRLHLLRVRSAAEVRNACDQLRKVSIDEIEEEITAGSIPRFMKRIPFRSADCESGTVWKVDRTFS